ncbi:MAG: glycosyltransferase family 4 protein [Prevotella sp.]|nr:glycosyltransferase family 4 protein [Prevotella sp.]
MKIAIIHLGRKGAGPVYTLEMAKALHALGHEVFYYASSAVENRKSVEEQAFHKRFFDTYNSGLEYAFSILSLYKIKRVIDSIKKDAPDVVYSCMNDLWAPFIFPKLKGITRVKTIHDVGIHEGNNTRFNIWWNNTGFKDAEKFVILSRKFVPKLVERGISEDRIVVIPHAGFDYYTKLGSEKKLESKNPVILFFGRIDQYKGISVLLQALPKVIEKHPDAILRIAGNGNLQAEMPMIEQLGNNIDLQNRWIKDEEVSGLVEDATFVVLPYTHATQSGVIPLAYAFRKPVVATNVGCLDEQVVEGETGYMCEGSDAKALAEAMIKMLDNIEYTKQMGIKANEYMQKYLTWDASARLFVDFISK